MEVPFGDCCFGEVALTISIWCKASASSVTTLCMETENTTGSEEELNCKKKVKSLEGFKSKTLEKKEINAELHKRKQNNGIFAVFKQKLTI